MARYEHQGGAKATTLVSGINSGTTSISITDATGWPTGATNPFWIAINRGKAAEEKILITSRSGTVLTVSARGQDGTTAASHETGATVEHIATATEIDKFDAHVEDTTRDDHTQYAEIADTETISAVWNFTATPTISGTAVETTAGSQAKVDTHSADTTSVHGITDTSVLAVKNADNSFSAKQTFTGEVEVDGALNHDGTTVGFYGVTPVTRPAAYTQTYSTADRTLSAYTADDESTAYTGVDNAQAGSVYATVADLNALRVAVENLRAFTEDAVGVLNSVVDDLQSLGLAQ